MTRAVRKKGKNKKNVYAVTLFIFLLAAAGAGLYRLPPSLLDVGINFRLAANKILSKSADKASAEAVLRGTIFDRNLQELAVSYQLYALFVRPSEVSDIRKVISALSQVTSLGESELEIRLKNGGTVVKIADNLEQDQVEEINAFGLAGVICKPVEERFYPENEIAAEIIGYAEDGIGLAGIEGTCDTILQHGHFQAGSVPEIDFSGSEVLGNSKLDIILTLDIGIQKTVERNLEEYLHTHGADRGLVIIMNAKTGAVLAWAKKPSFNPNYFWQLSGSRNKDDDEDLVDMDLYRDMLVRVAAVRINGELNGKLLPETVAREDYGVNDNEIREAATLIGLDEAAACRLPHCGDNCESAQNINALQFITAAASLLNGGWKVQPYVLESVYDELQAKRYERSEDPTPAGNRRIMSPSAGIAVRMNLPDDTIKADRDIYLHKRSVARIMRDGFLSRYVMQDMMIGAIPAKSPEIIMLAVSWQDNLNPQSPSHKQDRAEALLGLGKKVIPAVQALAAAKPGKKRPENNDTANYNRFLISRRIDYRDQKLQSVQGGPVMPELTGLSLRKGLQRLNAYNLSVRIEGSGRIIDQQPQSGKSLQDVGECTLVLESNI